MSPVTRCNPCGLRLGLRIPWKFYQHAAFESLLEGIEKQVNHSSKLRTLLHKDPYDIIADNAGGF